MIGQLMVDERCNFIDFNSIAKENPPIDLHHTSSIQSNRSATSKSQKKTR